MAVRAAALSVGKPDLRVFGEGAVQHHGPADRLDHVDPVQAVPDGVRRLVHVARGRPQGLHLEELPAAERLLHGIQDGLGHAVGADLEDGLEVVGQGAETGALLRRQVGDGTSR